ncbi:MAG: coiled-coil domain-containing protein [Ilumatobacteraceae bacterium]
MTISETARLEMFGGLQKSLGEAVANTLIEHLPPGGWFDVARTGDFDRIEIRLDKLDNRIDKLEARLDDRIDKLETRIDKLEARLDDRIDKLEARIDGLTQKIETNTRWMIGISLTYGIGIIGVLVTFMVASLN